MCKRILKRILIFNHRYNPIKISLLKNGKADMHTLLFSSFS